MQNKHIMTELSLAPCNFEDWGIIRYNDAWSKQEERFKQIINAKKNRQNTSSLQSMIFCQHPHVYTLGKSGCSGNLLLDTLQLQAKNAEFVKTNRGGDITYHGPGQLVAYPILDLETLHLSLKEYIYQMEESIIDSLQEYNIKGARLTGATGVWIATDTPTPRKICAIGVRSSRYVTMHGLALNINTEMNYFNYINPCGFIDKGVTSMAQELGVRQDFPSISQTVKEKLQKHLSFKYKQ